MLVRVPPAVTRLTVYRRLEVEENPTFTATEYLKTISQANLDAIITLSKVLENQDRENHMHLSVVLYIKYREQFNELLDGWKETIAKEKEHAWMSLFYTCTYAEQCFISRVA